ncbi:interleukin-12 subunit beta-like [Arapaima gigas]
MWVKTGPELSVVAFLSTESTRRRERRAETARRGINGPRAGGRRAAPRLWSRSRSRSRTRSRSRSVSSTEMPCGPCEFVFLLLGLHLTCGQASFPEHMVLAKVDDTVHLSCRTNFQDSLSWKHKESDVVPSGFRMIQGKELILEGVDIPLTGQYSCWRGGQKLDQMDLLLTEEDEFDNEEQLSCSAQTYNCTFTCSWSLTGFTAARLTYQRDGETSAPWVSPRSKTSNSERRTFEFTLSLSDSPFAEESAPLVVTGEAVSSSHYLRRVHQFYLRDIVQPDPPQFVQCEKMGNVIDVTVHPADTWAQPLSYFPLIHQIEFELRNDGKTHQSNDTKIPKEISKLRVRSRDPLVPSPWSQWTPWKNVKQNKQWRSDGDTIVCRKRKGPKKTPKRPKNKHHKSHLGKKHRMY